MSPTTVAAMHWKVACSKSPMGVAFKQFPHGLVLRESSGKATYYMYKNFPHINRPATPDELSTDTGYIPLTKKLPSAL